jgi:hypothetical protein
MEIYLREIHGIEAECWLKKYEYAIKQNKIVEYVN